MTLWHTYLCKTQWCYQISWVPYPSFISFHSNISLSLSLSLSKLFFVNLLKSYEKISFLHVLKAVVCATVHCFQYVLKNDCKVQVFLFYISYIVYIYILCFVAFRLKTGSLYLLYIKDILSVYMAFYTLNTPYIIRGLSQIGLSSDEDPILLIL